VGRNFFWWEGVEKFGSLGVRGYYGDFVGVVEG